ncbi:MAG: hypothetical protein MZU84_04685 [Sphingobacterium sp.]|nr:hypothetical protein [Sphingobacterium sp.]
MKPAVAAAVPGAVVRHRRVRVQGPHRARRRRHRAGPDQRHHQGGERRQADASTSCRATASATRTAPSGPGYGTIKGALERENYGVERLALIQAGAVPDDATAIVVAGPTSDLLPPEDRRPPRVPREGRQAAAHAGSSRHERGGRPANCSKALAHEWGIQLGSDVIVDASGIGQLIGIELRHARVACRYPQHPITERFDTLTAFPAGAVGLDGARSGRRRGAGDSSRPASAAGPRPTSTAWRRRTAPSSTRPRATGRAPSAWAPRPRRPSRRRNRRRRQPAEAKPPETRVVGDGRRGLRVERRHQHLGQPRPLHEHRRLAVAAGEPDRHPAQGAGRQPPDAHQRRGAPHRVARAVRACRAPSWRWASTRGGGGGDARLQVDVRPAARPAGTCRLHLLLRD